MWLASCTTIRAQYCIFPLFYCTTKMTYTSLPPPDLPVGGANSGPKKPSPFPLFQRPGLLTRPTPSACPSLSTVSRRPVLQFQSFHTFVLTRCPKRDLSSSLFDEMALKVGRQCIALLHHSMCAFPFYAVLRVAVSPMILLPRAFPLTSVGVDLQTQDRMRGCRNSKRSHSSQAAVACKRHLRHLFTNSRPPLAAWFLT